MHIIPIASGKGGVGKSLVAANLSIALAQEGKRVLLVDLDLGASNIHSILGVSTFDRGIGSFLNDKNAHLEDYIVKTEYSGLDFIPGDAEIPGIANITLPQKKRIISRLKKIDTDFLILDLGAGTNYNTIDFFLMSGNGIMVTTPALTSTLNAYLFLKNIIFRVINISIKSKNKSYSYFQKIKNDGKSLQKVYIPQLLSNINKIDPESYQSIMKILNKMHLSLILNMLDEPKDTITANKLRRSSKEYLGLNLDHLGIIYRDELQKTALSSRLPIIIYKPESVLSQAIYRVSEKLLSYEFDESSIFEDESYDESYQAAEMEAEIDFSSKMTYIEDLLHCGALSTGELVEIVKSQQLELNKLKKENNFLKNKLLKAAKKGYKI